MYTARIVVVALCTICASNSAWGSVFDDPREVIADAARACRQVERIVYQVEEFERTRENELALRVQATIAQKRDPAVAPAGLGASVYKVEGQVLGARGEARAISWAYDGRRLRVLVPSQREVLFIENPTPGDAGRTIGGMDVSFHAFGSNDPFAHLLEEGVTLESLGEEEVAGTRCRLVRSSRELQLPDGRKVQSVMTFGIGADDHLPRLMRTSTFERRVTSLRFDVPMDEGFFQIEVPPGFAERALGGGVARSDGLIPVGQPAPDWRLSTPDGEELALSDYRGRFVLMDFWGTWCYPCRKAIPSLERLHRRFADRGLVVLGVSVKEPPDADPAKMLRDLGATYQTLVRGDNLVMDYKVPGFPTLYLISPAGKVLHAEFGFRDGAEAEIAGILEREMAIQLRPAD